MAKHNAIVDPHAALTIAEASTPAVPAHDAVAKSQSLTSK